MIVVTGRVAVARVLAVSDSGNTQFDVVPRSPLTAAGAYELAIWPDVRDMWGNPLDQNDDLIGGDFLAIHGSAFDIVGKGHENPSMQALIMAVKQDVESGTALTQALGKHPLYFDALYCNLVQAGEQAGILDSILDKLATYKEKIENIKGKIKSALFYPAAVIVVAFIITAVLLVFVIPQFEDLFKGFGADLPALTKMVISLSRTFTEWWWAIIGSIVGSVMFLGYTYKRSEKMQHTMDSTLLKAPEIGVIVKKATIARFARTLATMFAAGVPLVEALDSVAGASGNRVYY